MEQDQSAQFAQPSQYPYPPSSHPYQMDHDMQQFAADVQHATGGNGGMQDATQESHQTHSASSGLITTGIAPGMAPPQNSAQAYSPSGARPSIDDTQDPALSGGDPKRKRSKVSRACDECRRKKVRCDAAADDGTIKTCSNCQRSGAICGYNRVPMKRGPSKGYIKELSERVQQVESQMALSSTPGNAGFRQSLDANGSIYPDQVYSPDDPSYKRNFSFSEQRTPFVNPDYNRERIPSMGGWATGSPHASSFRFRDRGSIAVAPDQHAPMPTSFSKPFWASDERPAKRQKLDVEPVQPPEMQQEMLDTYYQQYHPFLPILPNVNSVTETVSKADSRIQHAFCAAIHYLPKGSMRPTNGQNGNNGESKGQFVFESKRDFQQFVWDQSREAPELRSPNDNLVLIWIYLLVAVESENDLNRLRDGVLPKAVAIKQSVDLGWSCIRAESKAQSIDEQLTSGEQYQNHLAQAWYCASILARLHAIAVGASNPIPNLLDTPSLPKPMSVLPDSSAWLALTSINMSAMISAIQMSEEVSQPSQSLNITHRDIIRFHNENIISQAQLSKESETLSQQYRHFTDVLLSRYTAFFSPDEILRPTLALAHSLQEHHTAIITKGLYDPLSLHFFTLCVVTLLEFIQNGISDDVGRRAANTLNSLQSVLRKISEVWKAATMEHHDDGKKASEAMHWADALLKLIEARKVAVASGTTEGVGGEVDEGPELSNANPSTDATSNGVAVVNDAAAAVVNEEMVSVDFSALLKFGYLNVLI